MAYYSESNWPAPGRQASWEQPQPPSRSGTPIDANSDPGARNNTYTGASSTVNNNTFEANAFVAQFDGTLQLVAWLARIQCTVQLVEGGRANIRDYNKNLANNATAEVDRAAENLAKSGKGFGFPQVGGANRRDSMPVMAPRQYPEQYGRRTS
jgi:hypothetical protein